MAEPTINFKQGINGPYYSTIILLVLFFFLSLFLYFSYIIFTRKNEPLVVSSYDYDLYINSQKNSNSGDLLSADNPEGYKNPTDTDLNKLKDYQLYQQCSSEECVFDINTGFKRCPQGDEELIYDIRSEQCVKKSQCPPLSNFPYAVTKNGEALSNTCEADNPGCQCVAVPQCANKVLANFITVNGNVYNSDSKGYGFTISKPKVNFYDNLKLTDSNQEFCKLNPAYTDKIINACDFQNSIGDPMNCLETQDIFTQTDTVKLTYVGVIGYKTSDITVAAEGFVDTESTTVWTYDQNFFAGAQELMVQYPNTDSFNPRNQGFIFVNFEEGQKMMRYSSIENFASYSTRDIGDKALELGERDVPPVIPTQVNTASESSNILVHIYGLEYYDTTNNSWVTGVYPGNYTFDQTTLTIPAVLLNVCFPDDFGANFKNMLNCVQSFNQPCKDGTLTYNVDKPNQKVRGTFCKASIIEGVKGRLDFTDTKYYLKDVSFYTTSCLIGKGCNKFIDKSLYTMIKGEKNYAPAVAKKKSKMLPYFDCSAVSNVWFINKTENNFSNLSSKKITFDSSVLELEQGDYWLEGRSGNITLTVKERVKSGSSIQTFENPWAIGVSIGNYLYGVSQIPPQSYIINDIYPNQQYPNKNGVSINFTFSDTNTLNKKNTLTVYPENTQNQENDFFGKVILFNESDYQLSAFDDPATIVPDLQSVTFFKQFGFNGINYNTYYDLKDKKRYYTPSYQNYRYFEGQSAAFTINPNNNQYIVTPPLAISQLSYLNIRTDNPAGNTINQYSFLDASANFKIESSMYYPVWNDDKFQQECMLCQPTFVTFLQISGDNKINGAQIQFSSQDFKQYAYTNNDYYFCNFFQVKDSAGRDDLTSNSSLIILDEYFGTDPSNNIYGIKKGDYVIDQDGFLAKQFAYVGDQYSSTVSLKGSTPTNLNIIPSSNNPNLVSYEKADDRYNPYTLEGNQVLNYNSAVLSPVSGSVYGFDNSVSADNKKNFYVGKYYTTTNTGTNPPVTTNTANNAPALFEIKPLVKITDIRTDPVNRLTYIYTNSGDNNVFRANSLVQFISQDETLELTVSRRYESEGVNPPDNNAVIKANGITDGRITDLKITDPGANYFQSNKPVLLVTKYHDYILGKRFI